MVEKFLCQDQIQAIDMMKNRGYSYDRHQPWPNTEGLDYYKGSQPEQFGCVRSQRGEWYAIFFEGKLST